MDHREQKGHIEAEIPASAVDEALRAVEQAEARRAVDAPAPGEAGGDAGTDAGGAARLAAELDLSQALARETKQKLDEVHDRWLRAVADLENYRKRAQREKEEVQKFGIERLLLDLLPVLDNLDRALAVAPAGDPLVDGVKLVRASLEQVLGRHGVKPFSALGQRFDPARHEALLQVPTTDAEPGTVVLEHGRGFTLADRLVRPAMVGVAVAPAPAGAGGGEAA